MADTTNTPSNIQSSELREPPKWAWVLACLVLPAGPFIVFGYARILTWKNGVLLAVVSYAHVIGFCWMVGGLEDRAASHLLMQIANGAQGAMFGLWFYLIYRIGRNASYWSPATLRGWRVAGWFAVALGVIFFVGLALIIAAAALQYLTPGASGR